MLRNRSASFCVLLGSLVLLSRPLQAADTNAEPHPAVAKIRTALDEAKDADESAAYETLLTTAREALELSAKNVLVTESLTQAVAQAEKAEPKDAATTLRKTLQDAEAVLSFRLKKEANLPKGFPEPTPVGEIQIKKYPAYRLARAPSTNDSAFFLLFAHIKKNKIEMTAPVEMTFKPGEADKPLQQVDMAFLYEDPALGKLGPAELGVKVEDVPAITTVSIGLTGESNPARLTRLEPLLEKWLTAHAPDYQRAGNLRVLGYNSPMVKPAQRYWEVELPLQRK